MSSMKKCLLKFFTHFLNSVICLLLFWSWVAVVSYIFWILAPYTKFADMSSHSIACLFILLIVQETILSSLGNFRTLAKTIWPHVCELFEIPLLWFIGLSACFVAAGTLFWLLWLSYVFWIHEAWVTIVVLCSQGCSFSLRSLLGSISINIFWFFFHLCKNDMGNLWVVTKYMYITFSSIGESTALNIPVYECGMSLWLLVSSFFQHCPMVSSAQIFHFLRRLSPALLGSSRVRNRKDGLVKWVNVPPFPLFLPSCCLSYRCAEPCPSRLPTSEPLTGNFLWIWVFTLLLNVCKDSPNAWPGSMSPRYTYKCSDQAIKLSALKNNQNRMFVAFSLSLKLLEWTFQCSSH